MTVKIDNRIYRVTGSTIPDGGRFEPIRAAYLRRGIKDKVNALPPRAVKSHVQIYLMADGTARKRSYQIDCEVARECATGPKEKK